MMPGNSPTSTNWTRQRKKLLDMLGEWCSVYVYRYRLCEYIGTVYVPLKLVFSMTVYIQVFALVYVTIVVVFFIFQCHGQVQRS